MTLQDNNEEMNVLDAEEELKKSAAQRPTRTAVAPSPISGMTPPNGDAPGTNVEGVTRLATRQGGPQSQLAYPPQRDGSRDITREDIKVPSIKISQSLSGVVSDDTMKVGNWYYTLDNTNWGPKIKVVAFDLYKSRSYMIQGAGLSCRSVDMYIGIGDPGGDCESCELKNWPPAGTKGGPKCRVTYNFPVAVIPDDFEEGMALEMGLIRLSGTSAEAGQNMIGIQDNRRVPWHAIMWELTAVKAPFGNSFYFKAVARLANRTGAIPDVLAPEIERWAAVARQGVIKATDEGGEES